MKECKVNWGGHIRINEGIDGGIRASVDALIGMVRVKSHLIRVQNVTKRGEKA